MALNLNPIALRSHKYPTFPPPTMAKLRLPKFLRASTFSSGSIEVKSLKKPFSSAREVHVHVTQSMPPEKREIFKNLEDWAEKNILVHLKPAEECWQPQDFLPDPASDGFHDQVMELRERAKEIPDDYFVCLVGDMITEEALPTYQTMLNTGDDTRDETGGSLTSWAEWTRGWTAEEYRHGNLLNKYLYLCGRVDMRQIEKTIQYLIGSGMSHHVWRTNKRFKSTLTTHQGAPVWVIEEVQPEQPLCKPEEPQPGKLNIEDHMGEELDQKLSVLAEANLPGVSLQWDANEGWKFCFPEEPEPMPEKITLMMKQDDGELAVMPPVKYFDANGQPVYYFEDPIMGHKYWDECDGMTPQQLKDQCEGEKKEDPRGKGKADETRSSARSTSPNPPSS